MTTPVRGYIHCTMLNDFLLIMKKILDAMVVSGFVERAESVSVGVLGNADRLDSLKELIAQYPSKVYLRGWDENKNRWEGHTVQWVKEDADNLPKFIGLYTHTKGCTYGIESEGERGLPENKLTSNFWLDYMLSEIVLRWKVGYGMLTLPEISYDIFGCRAIPQRHSGSLYSHYSGNFLMFQSDYVKVLPKITDDESLPDIEEQIHDHVAAIKNLCKNGRVPIEGGMFTPEMYWSFGQPIMNIACNAFTIGFPTAEGTFEQYLSKNDLSPYRTNA